MSQFAAIASVLGPAEAAGSPVAFLVAGIGLLTVADAGWSRRARSSAVIAYRRLGRGQQRRPGAHRRFALRAARNL